jgi:hypothetical protein
VWRRLVARRRVIADQPGDADETEAALTQAQYDALTPWSSQPGSTAKI